VSDNIVVMYEGSMSEPIARHSADTEHIGLLMAGRSGR
jgi:ABC-type uncharacterized transport system ATPase subunit